MTYTLIGHPTNRTVRVIWALEELGQPYKLAPAYPRSDEVRAYNPMAKVPVLLEGGTPLIDSVAICLYLAQKHGALSFVGGSPEYGQMLSFTQFAVDELERPLWTAALHSFALPEEQRVKDPAELKESCRWEFARALKALEARFGDGPYVMGGQFTVPDVLIGHASLWARQAKFDWPATGPLAEYAARITARPAARKMLEIAGQYRT